MRRPLPRLDVIEAFLEAARAPSFRVAAERCGVSPAAFSRRVQAFARAIGQEVFERSPSGMRLTDAGRECLVRLEPIHQEMRRAALELSAKEIEGNLTISLSHSLAVGWLIPRLKDFREKWPAIDVTVQTDRTAGAVRSGAADVGISAADVDLDGLHVEHLLDMDIAPVASPERAAAFRASGRLDSQPLLSMAQHSGVWSWYVRETGAPCGVEIAPLATFDVLHAMYEAAAAGLGIAAGTHVTLLPHLQSGRLEYLGLPSARYPNGYKLVAAPRRMKNPGVRALCGWLKEAARNSTAGGMQPRPAFL